MKKCAIWAVITVLWAGNCLALFLWYNANTQLKASISKTVEQQEELLVVGGIVDDLLLRLDAQEQTYSAKNESDFTKLLKPKSPQETFVKNEYYYDDTDYYEEDQDTIYDNAITREIERQNNGQDGFWNPFGMRQGQRSQDQRLWIQQQEQDRINRQNEWDNTLLLNELRDINRNLSNMNQRTQTQIRVPAIKPIEAPTVKW